MLKIDVDAVGPEKTSELLSRNDLAWRVQQRLQNQRKLAPKFHTQAILAEFPGACVEVEDPKAVSAVTGGRRLQSILDYTGGPLVLGSDTSPHNTCPLNNIEEDLEATDKRLPQSWPAPYTSVKDSEGRSVSTEQPPWEWDRLWLF